MITAIGLMIGAYIATRMIELLGHRKGAQLAAALTLLVVAFAVLDLLIGGALMGRSLLDFNSPTLRYSPPAR